MKKREKLLSISSGKDFPIPTPHKPKKANEVPFMDILLHFNTIVKKKPNQRGDAIHQGLKIMREEIQNYIPSLYMTTESPQDVMSMETKNLFHMQLFKLYHNLINLIDSEFSRNELRDKVSNLTIKEVSRREN